MNDNDNVAEPSLVEDGYAIWSEDPAISHLIALVGKNHDPDGLKALLKSAFEAGWSGGFNRAMD